MGPRCQTIPAKITKSGWFSRRMGARRLPEGGCQRHSVRHRAAASAWDQELSCHLPRNDLLSHKQIGPTYQTWPAKGGKEECH
jgi:hypothetical protein